MDNLRQLKLIKKEAQRIADYLANFQGGNGTTDANGDASVTFAAPYKDVPKVFLQGVDATARGIVMDVVSKSKTGFTAKARKVTGLPTDKALWNLHYTTASAVTGIPTATEFALGSHSHTVTSHTHSIGSPSTANFVTGAGDPGHRHNITSTGAPTTTTSVMLAHSAALYAAGESGGATTYSFWARRTSPGSGNVASSTHTHPNPDTGLNYTGITLYVASAVTGIPSATGSAAPGTSSVDLSHKHSIGATTTTDFVNAIAAYPEDYITVVTGDAPVLSVDFDWFAILP